MASHAQKERASIRELAHAYMMNKSGPDMVADACDLYQKVTMCSLAEAQHFVQHALAPTVGEVTGLRTTTPMHWSYDRASMWRGDPDNRRVLKLARSIISSGFSATDGAIASRTLSLSAQPGEEIVRVSLLFGDGSARGVAACSVWMLLMQHKDTIPARDEQISSMVLSLMAMPTNFERHGSGTPQECLIAQAARQNAKAAVLPVSTLQWIGMTVDYFGLKIGGVQHTTAGMEKALQVMVDAYNHHPLVEAYHIDVPATKKRRTSRAKKADDDDCIDHGLTISRRRLIAMKSFLAGGTETGRRMLDAHLVVISDWRASVMTDDIMARKWLYVGSRLPVEDLPSDVDLVMRDAGAAMAKALVPPQFSTSTLQFDTPLTPKQFELMLNKSIRVYEANAQDERSDEGKARHRPNENHWRRYRTIVQRWDETISDCASKDLSVEDYKLLEETVLTSDTMDNDLMNVLSRFPAFWHMGLIPHILGDAGPSKDAQLASLTGKQQAAAQAQFDQFVAEVEIDWGLIDEVHMGYMHLRDILMWNENRHRISEANKGEALVHQHMQNVFPICDVASWEKVASQVHMMSKQWDAGLIGARRVVILMDFNCPGARDTMRLPQMMAQAANLSAMFGHEHVCLLAWMPNLPKEGSLATADDTSTQSDNA